MKKLINEIRGWIVDELLFLVVRIIPRKVSTAQVKLILSIREFYKEEIEERQNNENN